MASRSMQSSSSGSLSTASIPAMNSATIAALNSINSAINAAKSNTNSPATNSPKFTPKSDTSTGNNPGTNNLSSQSTSTNSSSLPAIVRPSLEIPLLPHEKLYPTPSMNDSLSFDDEFDLRLIGCELIQTAGRLLKLPQVQYYNVTSFKQFCAFLKIKK